MTKIHELDTPIVLVDLDRVEANLKRAQDYANAHGVKLRPHIKTHKLPQFAKRQMELGAIGITCQKIGEAEVMADAGITDIFLPYNILGAPKLKRLLALARRASIKVIADSVTTIDGYSKTFAASGVILPVLVECDTGGGRVGVQTPEQALALAKHIAGSEGLRFAGLMTYPAKGMAAQANAWLERATALLKDAGLPPETVSTGGTPDLWRSGENRAATEYRPGTYIYLDRFQVQEGVGSFEDCALTVLATVVSRPTDNRAVLDTGSKSLTSDTLGLQGFGRIVEYPDAVIASLSEEHGVVDLTNSKAKPEVSEMVRIIPNHVCPVTNLFDEVTFVRGDEVVGTAAVAARGKVA
ncbi:D-TA family PLP-dependent enzyme [Microvirga guangxiensis]|uniref:D-serine deaminase, pyridoxal phosphate-dependent n=1 Tax=Microvirga guangxiensis TaxID=549386 RepID=A0A1G5IU85_9HYPH|nr:D-TA family PLP-dependent enzyme [Microvirga guangxiensis]SCY79606.1 D-serine deaminase, pyridoxal phosphate-dependent [Microvirga guangxiensis]